MALRSKNTSAAERPKNPPAPKATARGPINVDTAQGAPRMPKMIAPKLAFFLWPFHAARPPVECLPCRVSGKPSPARENLSARIVQL